MRLSRSAAVAKRTEHHLCYLLYLYLITLTLAPAGVERSPFIRLFSKATADRILLRSL